MVAALKKIVPEDFSGRFSAWWEGREYSAPIDGEAATNSNDNDDDVEGAEAASPPSAQTKPAPTKAAKPQPKSPQQILSPEASRIAAVETLWGEGRLSPGSSALYSRITEGMSALDNGSERLFGALNTDPALTQHVMGTSGACPVVSEWRLPCIRRFEDAFPDFEVLRGDLDRPAFEPGSLALLVSQDGYAYSDHKSGLAVRAYRSLEPGGQWIVIDTVRGAARGRLEPAFASSWAEPQLCDSAEIIEISEAAGFELSSDEDDVTGDVIQASRSAFERFGQDIEKRLSASLEAVNKQVFMRELAWEAEAWKWRQRALAGELIHVKVWKFRKPSA